MQTFRIIQNGDDYLLPVYNRHKIVLMRGEGPYIYDSERMVYLDFLSGIAVNSLGQASPEIVNAIAETARKIGHVSNYFYNEPNVQLAKLLCEISFAQKVFFCNSGAEAIEASIKIARKYFNRLGQDRFEIISFKNSFHGRTYGALSVTGQMKYQDGFGPMLPGVQFADFNDIESVKKLIRNETAAVLVECIQCEGGIHQATPSFMTDLRNLTRENGILLIIDEVQTGLGRTGKMWAYEHYEIEPDIMTSAKALGAGLPMGAMLVTNQVATGFKPGDHASTFGGNPIVSSAAVANIETIILKDAVSNAAKQGLYLRRCLEMIVQDFPNLFTEIRGVGLVLGLQMTREAASLVFKCTREGLLVGVAHETVLRFLPPLIITKEEIDLAMEKLRKAIAVELQG